ncbi:MAG: cytochrome b/b6 domain-containing protein [Parasphingorhabdus sp.]|uniref:cytochrome b/b6 domain-containing protein n=1 Tax=Parasphingorhabdus sp. TaxID=2709688 RepID=UPI003264C72B
MTTSPSKILVWDWTIRLVHWLMVVLVPLLWWTAEEGHMDWHKSLGLTMFSLVLFRLIWGFMGSWTARFVPMVRRIGSLRPYLGTLRNRQFAPTFGHSPLSVLSVFALLLALVTQVTTGLFSVDVDGLESGPLAIWISFETGREAADIHEFNFKILSLLIGLHLIAIAIYRFVIKEKLVWPMISGHRDRQDFPSDLLPENRAHLLPVIIAATLSLASVFALVNLG